MDFGNRWLKRWPWWWVAFWAIWFLYFSWFWTHAFWNDVAGNIVAGHINIWGDWAAHFTMGSRFAYVSLSDLASPFLIDQRLSYPFITNWLAAVAIRAGVPFISSFVILSWLGSLAIVAGLGWWYQVWFKSKATTIVATLLFLCNGGLGFIWYLNDVFKASQPWLAILNPQHEYTHLDSAGLRWMSVIDSMIVPQRAFNLGFPIALALLILIWRWERGTAWTRLSKRTRRWQLGLRVMVGLGWGILPIIHTHSFLAVSCILAGWAVATMPTKSAQIPAWFYRWAAIGVPAVLVATPLYVYFFAAHTTRHFISWYPGWYATEYGENWFWWWFKNWGLVPALAVVGSWQWLQWPKKDWWRRACWIAPFWTIFAAINLFLFQPYIWDNTKLVVWASVGISGLAAGWLTRTWQRWWLPAHGWLAEIFRASKLTLLSLIGLSLFAAGALDAYWVLRTDLHSYTLYSAEEWQLAEWARQETEPRSRWLTSDQHNHWVYNLAGRQPMLAYRGWVWTHGYDYQGIEQDVRTVFANPVAHRDILERYDLDYVVLGPTELEEWGARPAHWAQVGTLINQTENYSVYRLK